MKNTEIKAIEAKVSNILGYEVELVKPTVVKMHQEESLDMKLLEMENKQSRMIREAKERSAARKESRVGLFGNLNIDLDRIDNAFAKLGDKAIDVVNNLDKVTETKAYRAYRNFFFDDEIEIVGHYDHQKDDVVAEGNITYLSRDFKNVK